MLENGFQVEKYVVEAELGRGAAAVVYRVRHGVLGTRHALKVLTLTGPSLKERLIREGQVQARLRHPNLVPVTDVVDVDGMPGLLAEYVEGPTLERWLFESNADLELRLAVFKALLEGIGAAHAAGVVHRDLKPSNVLLEMVPGQPPRPRVSDFGIARVVDGDSSVLRTRTHTMMGTPAYMAPEQFRDAASVDARADIFSLGCILYEMATGRRAFPQQDILSIARAVDAGDYVPPGTREPGLPVEVERAITGALEPEREQRIPSCEAFRAVLEGAPWPGDREEIPARMDRTAEISAPPTLERRVLPERRERSAPTLTADDIESMPDTGTLQPDTGRRLGLVLGGAALTILVIGIGMAWSTKDPPQAVEAGTRAGLRQEAQPVEEPIPSIPTEEGQPEASSPPARPERPPAPVESAPVASAPATANPEPSPWTTPPEPEQPRVATVSLRGGARSVVLVRGQRRYPPGQVPPGTYEVYAVFDEARGEVNALSGLVVPDGGRVLLRCNADFEQCSGDLQ